VGDGLADTANRTWFPEFVADLTSNPQFEIVPADNHWFRAGLNLYRQRPDKEWSLTDCISFEIMRTRDLTEALTTDHHFTQAGFRALLRE
jgi:predicted nucleic acid-binding protein